MLFRLAVISLAVARLGYADLAVAASSPTDVFNDSWESVSVPLPPKYRVEPDGSVELRICFNWSCSNREFMKFTSSDLSLLKSRMATCSGTDLHDRLQRVRIGIWQMELLAQKYQPLLANDRSINEFDAEVRGRMDCVDNSSNTTTYLKILSEIGALSGWTVSSPRVRNRFDVNAVHWTAVIVDTKTGDRWSVDSWFRPNGHLPMVMPIKNWVKGQKAWEPPFADLNPTPHSIDGLCETPRVGALMRR